MATTDAQAANSILEGQDNVGTGNISPRDRDSDEEKVQDTDGNVPHEEDGDELTCGIFPRAVRGTLCTFGPNDRFSVDYYMNPVTMLISVGVIWIFVIWCAADEENAGERIGEVQTFIVDYFTWFYVASFVFFGSFITYLLFSRFGDIKLGPKDEPPMFGLATWFSMLFSAGVGVGLYFYGVAEPVWHYYDAKNGRNRYWNDSPNYQAMNALNISWFHWGLTASCVYCVVGLPLAYFTNVKGAPLKLSSAFVPLLGKKYANGLIGDIIDSTSVIGTMFGVSTSLGLGVIQINSGLTFLLGEKSVPSENPTVQIVTIWVVTAFATISVFSGLHMGIRRLSEGNFIFCLILLMYLFFVHDPFYLLNLFIQGIGFHFQHLFEVTFFCDAFQQAGFVENPVNTSIEDDQDYYGNWMSSWTIFYWGWWIAWSPFVGIFIAQISKGRTVREFILGNVLMPTLLTSIWLTVFGGLGLWHELTSDEILGLDCDNNAYGELDGQKVVYIECFSTSLMLFELISAYPLGNLMCVLALIGIVTYFVTSSDSASHVIDVLTANGNEEPPKLQRIFWALSEGAVASVLLWNGGNAALSALQTMSIASGLPFCVVLIALCYAFHYALRVDAGEINVIDINQIEDNKEKTILQNGNNGNNGNTNKGASPSPSPMDNDCEVGFSWQFDFWNALTCPCEHSLLCVKSLFLPCNEQVISYNLLVENYENNPNANENDEVSFPKDCKLFWFLLFITPPVLFIIFHILAIVSRGWAYVGWCFYIFFVCIGAYNRARIRQYYNIHGNLLCDCLAHACFWPWAITQERLQIIQGRQMKIMTNEEYSKMNLASQSNIGVNSNDKLVDAGNDVELVTQQVPTSN